MSDLGHFRKVDPAVVDDDPFWSVVRRRHPELGIVLLPDDPAPPGGAPPALDEAALDAVLARVLTGWAVLAPLLAEDGDRAAPSVRWAQSRDGHALVVTKGIRGLGTDGGTALLRAIARTLGQAGWRLAPGRRQDLPLLRATDGMLDVEAQAGPGATVVTLASGVLPVDEPARAAAQRRVTAEVAP